MTTFTDFTAGLENVNDYLQGVHHLSGTTALGSNSLRIVASANYSFSLKELICSVLGGHSFKLPNIQICIFANLNALLGLDKLQAALRSALSALADAFSSFMDALSIKSVLGRLNSILNEAINVANMINFCGSPINPIAIPNMLEQAFGSLLGKGDALISKIGIPPINSCLSFDDSGNSIFNVNAFYNPLTGYRDPEIFGDIAANYDAISIGEYGPLTAETELVNKINAITKDINDLIAEENNIKGAYDFGGSDFAQPTTGDECSTELGILHNPKSGGMADNGRIAASLKGVYDQLAGYPVQYINQQTGEVIEYPNIFHTFVTPEVLAILDQDVNDDTTVDEQIPVFDYCGNIVGYTTNTLQGNPNQKSDGSVPSNVTCPGDPANVQTLTGYDDDDERLNRIYPGTVPQSSPSDTTIASGISSGVGSVDEETGFSSIETSGNSGGVSGSNYSALNSRKRHGDWWFYHNQLENYPLPSDGYEGIRYIDLRRRSRGNYVHKHVITVENFSDIRFTDHDRKVKEGNSFEIMIEHIGNNFVFGNSNVIWDGGVVPTMNAGNYHIIEVRNFGGNGWKVTTTDNNYWLMKLVGSFPIP